MITKTRRMNDLLDWYENLLTPKQKAVMHLYYQQDYSLREIAQELEVSHNAIYDIIMRASNRLEAIEAQVKVLALYQKLQTQIEALKAKDIDAIQEIIAELEKL